MTNNIIQFDYTQDQFGYYTVGDFKTYSRLEAFEFGKDKVDQIKWHFNEAVYSSYDWTVEPTETLADLYRQRALNLREKYDYLVLWYSSGADSQNVLNSFVDNDIKIDEVASYINYDATKNKYDFMNGEIFNVAIPRIEKIKERQPWIKHRIIDLAQPTIDCFNLESTKFDWVYDMNALYNPNNATKPNMKMKIREWADMITAGKKIGFIFGADKPYVYDVDGKCYFKFVDRIHSQSAVLQKENRPWDFNELFYWSPAEPKIVIKQAHILKQYLKNVTGPTNVVSPTVEFSVQQCGKRINSIMHWVDIDTVHQLIYPNWVPKDFQIKPWSMFFTERDTWFFKTPGKTKRAWEIGLKHLWNNTPDKYKQDPTDITKGVKTMNNIYYLGKQDV